LQFSFSGEQGISVGLLHQHMHHILHRMHTCGINMRCVLSYQARAPHARTPLISPVRSPCASHSSATWASCEVSSSRRHATIWWTGRPWSRAAGPAPWAPSTPTSSSPRCPFSSLLLVAYVHSDIYVVITDSFPPVALSLFL
jgi:hypothetical protein